jgi:hypothetical protein
LAAIIGLGIASRLVHTGWLLIDKYLGDALYASVIYVILWIAGIRHRALLALILNVAIELFQLTGIAAKMLTSGNLVERLLARILGTHFAWLDILAYAAGIGGCLLLEQIVEGCPGVVRSLDVLRHVPGRRRRHL